MVCKDKPASNSQHYDYRYKLKSMLQLNSGEFAFNFDDTKQQSCFRIHAKDIKFRQDILKQCEPMEVFNLGYFCGLPLKLYL